MKENNQPLYEGCTKYSKLAFMLKLYHIKCMCGMINKAMTMILDLLKNAFEHAKFTNSMTWLASKNNQHGFMRPPRDSKAWKTFDILHPEFVDDP